MMEGSSTLLDPLSAALSSHRTRRRSGRKDHDQPQVQEHIASKAKLSLYAQIYIDYSSLFGGARNLINREDPQVRYLLETTADRFSITIGDAIGAHHSPFKGAQDIFNLVQSFLQRDLYISSKALSSYFPAECQAIEAICTVPKGSGMEAAKKDMPFACQNGLLCIIKDIIEERCFTFIRITNPEALEQKDIHSPDAFEISQIMWKHFFREKDRRRAFFELSFINLMKDAVEVRNTALHNDLVTTTQIFMAAETAIGVLKTFGNLLGEEKSPYEHRLLTLNNELQHWNEWSANNKAETRDELSESIAALEANNFKKQPPTHGNPFTNQRKEAHSEFLGLETLEKRWDRRVVLGAAFFKYASEMLKTGSMKKFHWPHHNAPVFDLTADDDDEDTKVVRHGLKRAHIDID